jgi:hypothetical protein
MGLIRIFVRCSGIILVGFAAWLIVDQIISKREISSQSLHVRVERVLNRAEDRLNKPGIKRPLSGIPICPNFTPASTITGIVDDAEVELCRTTSGIVVMFYGPGTMETIALRRTLVSDATPEDIARVLYDPTNGVVSAGSFARVIDAISGDNTVSVR